MNQLFSAIGAELSQGRSVALSIILEAHGSAPRGTGAAMALLEDGRFIGTVGGGAVEFEAQQCCKQLMQEYTPFTKFFNLGPGEAASLGMICGGDVTLYFQYLSADDSNVQMLYTQLPQLEQQHQKLWLVYQVHPQGWVAAAANSAGHLSHATAPFAGQESLPAGMLSSTPAVVKQNGSYWLTLPLSAQGHVYLFGGGHVARQLVPLLHYIFFETTVIDDRAEFASSQQFPQASQTIVSNFSQVFQQLTITPEDYIVIMTRGHLADYEVLVQALHTPARYIGMIGSRKKISATFTKLIAQDGFSYSEISRVQAPIGLPIGGETPEEIAMGVAAQLLAVRSGKV